VELAVVLAVAAVCAVVGIRIGMLLTHRLDRLTERDYKEADGRDD